MRACSISSCRFRPAGLPEAFLSRREWIKRFSVGSAVALVGGFKGTVLADIAPGTSAANILEFDIATLPTLQSLYGSMRFNLFGTNVTNGIITVTRGPEDVFYAVSAYCTHAGCIVEPYDNSSDKQSMVCNCHGSVYDIEGRVIEGVIVGQDNLPGYNTSFSGNVLRVEIPNLNFKVNSITLQAVNGSITRYRLTFPTKVGARYRVRYTADLATPRFVRVSSRERAAASIVCAINGLSPSIRKFLRGMPLLPPRAGTTASTRRP